MTCKAERAADKFVTRVPLEQQKQVLLTVMREELLQASCGFVHWLR